MPRKLKSDFVKKQFEKYGYSLPPDFEHRNNTTKYRVFDDQLQRYVMMTYKGLQYRIRTGRAEYEQPFEFYNMSVDDNESAANDSFSRWLNAKD